MKLDPTWRARGVSAAEAVALIPRGARIFVHGAAATPTPLLEAITDRTDDTDRADRADAAGLDRVDRVDRVDRLTLYHLHLSGACRFAEARYADRIRSVSLFTGPALRQPIDEGRADFMPIFLSDIPALFTGGTVPLDVALVQLSPPDRHGICTLGTSVDAARAAVDSARLVIAEVNARMPRTHGHTSLPLARVDAFVLTDRPLAEAEPTVETAVEAAIGEVIAALVDDGSTIQLGIGGIPNAVLARLGNKVDLGVHTEMFSDGLIPLLEGGVITNRHKRVHPGRTTTSFISGSRRLFDYVDDNSTVEFHPCDRTNDTALIRQNPRVVAINSAIEVDLTGQVCADSIGHRIFSGIGGQMDFIHGAAQSPGGKPIIALPSTAAGGAVSRITSVLKPGAGVVTTRGHVHWVVTEFGAVNLHGLTLRQRGEALVSIAHPDFRGELERTLAEVRHFTD